MDTATIIWWRFTSRRGTLATFPGQWVSAESVETMVAAIAKETKPLKIFIVRAPQPVRLRSLWACVAPWSLWADHHFLDAVKGFSGVDQRFFMAGKSFVYRLDDVEVREQGFALDKAGKTWTVEPKAFG